MEKPQPIKFSHFGFPQEEMLEVAKKRKKLVIGIPREDQKYENRVPLTPEAVEILVNKEHEIIIEKGAGEAANYSDNHYSENGGYIVENKKSVYQADVLLKVAPPTLAELDYMKGQQVLISSLHFNAQTEEYIKKLLKKKVTAIAFENIKDENHSFPMVHSMSAIAGTASVLIAAEYLSTVHGGKGVLLAGITGITPTEVVIIGAGTAAEFAVKAASGLGAMVKVFDHSVHKLRRLQNNLGMTLHTSVFHPKVLEKSLKSADVVIGAMHLNEKGPRYYVTEEMIKGMKKGTVIVDLSIDQGGCFETSKCRTHNDPVFVKHGVMHYCVPNLPSRVARTASIALSNVLLPIMQNFGDAGGINKHLKEDLGLRHGVYVFNGILTNEYIGNYFGIPSKNIDLLMAAF
jgi:alanine dehydrogenase